MTWRATWEKSGKKKGKPGLPGASDHPTLYQGCIALDVKEAFVRINVYTAAGWRWMHYPVSCSRYTVQRLLEADWQQHSPTLVLRAHSAELHIPQIKQIAARKVMERKHDPDLVTVAIDLKDAAHKVARRIAVVCAGYPGCILLFERLRKIKPGPGSKSRRMNRKRANQLRGKINQHARDKAYVEGVVTVEVNPHGTSQYCSRCGAKGERFSNLGGKRIVENWGKLFCCPVCHYEANADFNASANVHHSFYREWHWQLRQAKAHKAPSPSAVADGT